jgi:hypothetical protein
MRRTESGVGTTPAKRIERLVARSPLNSGEQTRRDESAICGQISSEWEAFRLTLRRK